MKGLLNNAPTVIDPLRDDELAHSPTRTLVGGIVDVVVKVVPERVVFVIVDGMVGKDVQDLGE